MEPANPIFVLTLLVLGFSSMIITITGIIKILKNDFKGEKVTWILILMIAFIGPILYLLKGRKLIVKKNKAV
ncbi:PLDc N-terminal domain-containing protein [Tenacibaculum sp. S7007]|uniref:PLDc N-terminal domain-containing protein n=1 Tax=Tenacibaculum pelagium TaxID=2759527 RepID=A0A839AKI0_9FLAO|nr:PLDc N-terminal domain-containing protein [Tenacibaculum pelagium]MBA6155642.1 PLDc N-terminal domain-containing protein [Tenacibaculum pelagium]